jgi:hypothetical protein
VTGLAQRLRRVSAIDVSRKAGGIFRDYVTRLYYPLHDLSTRQRLRCTPALFAIEFLVYQVDAVTEGAKDVDLDVARNDDYTRLHRYKTTFESLLRRAHAFNDAVAEQLDMGERYVRLENRVTSGWATGQQAGYEETIGLAELRPSDVRLLHAMIFARLRRPVDTGLMDLLWPVEVLADIANDLEHYHSDVARGQFNTYGAFVTLFGHGAEARLRAEIDRYEQMFRDRLTVVPPERRERVADLCARRYRDRVAQMPATRPP